MTELKLTGIPSELIGYYIKEVDHLMELSPPTGEDLYEVLSKLFDCSYQFWITYSDEEVHLKLITSIEYNTLWIHYLGGKSFRQSIPHFYIIEDWARSHGCKKVIAKTNPMLGRLMKKVKYIYENGNIVKEL